MIKYIGSKRLLINQIIEIIKKENPKIVLDLFSGTSRVGHALQNENFKVISNDINKYAHIIAQTYVQANPEDEHIKKLSKIIDDLNHLSPKNKPGWFTKTYCQNSKFFQEKNGLKIEAIREKIDELFDIKICFGEGNFETNIQIDEMKAILLSSLMEAADRVDSTCGLQMAYLKNWSKRSFNDLELRMPNLSKGKGVAIIGDAKESAKMPADLAYIDPPYNQHNYLGNYHIWETICLWDKPEVYGKAQKRADVKTRKSNFNSKKRIFDEFKAVIDNLSAPKTLVSFNNEGYLTKNQILSILESKFNNIDIIEVPYKRYVGAKIGIHNKEGEKVGEISHTDNVELLFMAK